MNREAELVEAKAQQGGGICDLHLNKKAGLANLGRSSPCRGAVFSLGSVGVLGREVNIFSTPHSHLHMG